MLRIKPLSYQFLSTLISHSDQTMLVNMLDFQWDSYQCQPPNLETFHQVINLLHLQEEEIQFLPHGNEILESFPASLENPLFYFQRESYLEAYSRRVFWGKLPQGESYLASVPDIPEQMLAEELATWMRQNPRIQNLRSLALSKIPLTRLPPEIRECPRLEVLSLVDIPLRDLPSEIGKLQALRELTISKTPLERLPPELSQLRNLVKVYLSHNRFRDINPLATLPTLRHLSACSNQIQQLPNTIDWPQIEIVDLTDNCLTELPEAFYTSAAMLICLSKNRLSKLSESIRRMTRLKSLKLDENQLVNLPSSLGELSNLYSISVAGNRLSQIPESLSRLASLEEIILRKNPISQRPPFLRAAVWTGLE